MRLRLRRHIYILFIVFCVLILWLLNTEKGDPIVVDELLAGNLYPGKQSFGGDKFYKYPTRKQSLRESQEHNADERRPVRKSEKEQRSSDSSTVSDGHRADTMKRGWEKRNLPAAKDALVVGGMVLKYVAEETLRNVDRRKANKTADAVKQERFVERVVSVKRSGNLIKGLNNTLPVHNTTVLETHSMENYPAKVRNIAHRLNKSGNLNRSSQDNKVKIKKSGNLNRSFQDNNVKINKSGNLNRSSQDNNVKIKKSGKLNRSSQYNNVKIKKSGNLNKTSQDNNVKINKSGNLNRSSQDNNVKIKKSGNLNRSSQDNNVKIKKSGNLNRSSQDNSVKIKKSGDLNKTSQDTDVLDDTIPLQKTVVLNERGMGNYPLKVKNISHQIKTSGHVRNTGAHLEHSMHLHKSAVLIRGMQNYPENVLNTSHKIKKSGNLRKSFQNKILNNTMILQKPAVLNDRGVVNNQPEVKIISPKIKKEQLVNQSHRRNTNVDNKPAVLNGHGIENYPMKVQSISNKYNVNKSRNLTKSSHLKKTKVDQLDGRNMANNPTKILSKSNKVKKSENLDQQSIFKNLNTLKGTMNLHKPVVYYDRGIANYPQKVHDELNKGIVPKQSALLQAGHEPSLLDDQHRQDNPLKIQNKPTDSYIAGSSRAKAVGTLDTVRDGDRVPALQGELPEFLQRESARWLSAGELFGRAVPQYPTRVSSRVTSSPRPPRAASASLTSLSGVNIVAMSLYGSGRRYMSGVIRNADLVRQNFPGWRLRVYTELPSPNPRYGVVAPQIIESLRERDVEIFYMNPREDRVPPMGWRFLVADDMTVDRFIIRDADSRLTERDAAAVRVWVASGRPFNCIRDHPSHARYAISGGLWGGIPAALRGVMRRSWRELMAHVKGNYMDDMNFLNHVVWPLVSHVAYCSDSVSCDVWPNAHPFPVPRYGYETVGQVTDERERGRQGDIEILRRAGENPKCAPLAKP